MSSQMMSSEPTCTVTIGEVHASEDDYGSNYATLRISNSGDKEVPPVEFVDHDSPNTKVMGLIDSSMLSAITVPPSSQNGHLEEDAILTLPSSVSTQTDVLADSVGLATLESSTSKTEPLIPSKKEDDCMLTCLYYGLQCCDCAIM